MAPSKPSNPQSNKISMPTRSTTPLNTRTKKIPKIDWNVMGFVSVAITLISTSFFFLIGWSYESNWYSYFGINSSEINIPVPQVLIRSVPIVIGALISLLLSYLFISLLIFVLESLKTFENKVVTKKRSNIIVIWLTNFWANLTGFWLSKENKLWLVLFASLALNLGFSYSIFPFSIPGNYFAMVHDLPFEGLLSTVPFGFIVFVIVYLAFQIMFSQPFQAITIDSFFGGNSKITFIVVFGIVYLFSILFISSSISLLDAASGRKGISDIGKIQRVYLVSHKALSMMGDLEISRCVDENICIYGPFGLIAETDNSFFLAKSSTQQADFSRNPWLYIMPRNDLNGSFSIVPESVSIPTSLPTATSSPAPTNTPSPSQTPTISVTATPQTPTSTPSP